MLSVAQAQDRLLERATVLEAVATPLAEAAGRILRADAHADRDSPPFDASAMDGFACRRAELTGPLSIAGESLPGQPFFGSIGRGQCVAILTGAPVPAGLDCVVKQEDTAREGSSVRVLRSDERNFIRRRGEDRRAGEMIVSAGTQLGAPELAVLAAAGFVSPSVTRPVRCFHVALGDELVAPSESPGPGAIRDTNSILISSLLAGQGAALAGQRRVGDNVDAIVRQLESLPEHDVLLISGGAGPGNRDPARPLLRALGYSVVFDGANLRPGKPLNYASRGSRHAFAIPGNPVSHWVVFHLFIAPFLRALQGHAAPRPVSVRGVLANFDFLPPPDPRPTYWPCRATISAGTPELSLLPIASSGDATGLVGANALLPLPGGAGTMQRGQPVDYFPCP
ncbi:MAG TPA: molybdopterin molybdotransferase MoeA [Candidatus Didemnitutus sp.]|nr:molybdopterin molybdotransferase MoeA [Candidatus Didemnitutus sp.]